MTTDELMETVKAKLPSRQAISVVFIRMRYHVLQMQARHCIQQLQHEGLIGWDWDASLGGYPVLHEKVES